MKTSLFTASLLKKVLCTVMVLVLATAELSAQQTTGSIHGTVKDPDGNNFGSVNVQIKNSNTGTTYGTVTNKYGWYSVSGLKPGTYEVWFSFIGYETSGVMSVAIKSAQDYALDFTMTESVVELEDIVISEASYSFSETKTGQTYQVGSSTIEKLPSANRSLLDYARLSPYSGSGNTMGGRDGRTTSLTIDGAILNNSMGLSSDLAGAGTPISVDAVEEMQIAIAPYDVRQSDFTGGGINVITKSGSNRFQASVYDYFHNQNMRGNKVDGNSLGERQKQSLNTTGFTVGGPVVKNRLFYFANAEMTTSPGPVSEWKLSADGVGNSKEMTSRVTQADMDAFKSALGQYGYNPGSTDLTDGGQTVYRLLSRIDFNISERHNLMLRYNWTGSTEAYAPNARSTVGSKMTSERVSQNAYAFSNNCYDIHDNAWSGALELNSLFGNRGSISNKLLATVSKVSNERSSSSSWFPHIDIMKDGDAFMSAGYELFSNGTGNRVYTYSVSDHLSWSAGHSNFMLGAAYQYQQAKTSYTMYGTGYYRYASLQDFIEQKAPVAFGMTYCYDGIDDPSSGATYDQTSAMFQAETRISDRLTATYGIRADAIAYHDLPASNRAIAQLDWTGHFKTPGSESPDYKSPTLDTGSWPDSYVHISPRIGFNWQINDKLVLHGGSGMFKGRIPMVFLTCIQNSSGMLQNTVTDTGGSGFLAGLENNFLYTEQSLREYLTQNGAKMQAGEGTLGKGSSITAISKDFKMPQVWKTSIALDGQFETSFPMKAGIEGIFCKDVNAVYVENWNQETFNSLGRFTGKDKRYDFSDSRVVNTEVSKSGGAMVLSNTDKGYGWSICTTLSAEPVRNLNVELSYIYEKTLSVSDMLGSSLSSTWSSVPNVNSPNEVVLRASSYSIPHRIVANATYSLEHRNSTFWGTTEFGLFYSGSNAGRFSYCYSNDMNGDGVNNDLMWIPSNLNDIVFVNIEDGAGNILYTAQEQKYLFASFVNQDRYLSSHLGEYAGANEALLPWLNRFDIHVAQNFKMVQLSLDIMNAGNLICSKWGVEKTNLASNGGRPLVFKGTNDRGEPTYQIAMVNDKPVTQSFEPLNSQNNCWYVQLGIKLTL
ncbi:MAG: TonB-dependent receptor [Bacteroidaceae bacterium]|nr:TonB-dependent receptor [Bacteroidaceae bacterium]